MDREENINEELELDFEIIELDDITALPETAASSGSSSDNVYSTCGSTSCCSSCCT